VTKSDLKFVSITRGKEAHLGYIPELHLERVAGYDVCDSDNEHVGGLTAIWVAPDDEPAFLGVCTTWLVGKTYVIPAELAAVDHVNARVNLRLSSAEITSGPEFEPGTELDLQTANAVRTHFGTDESSLVQD
jgi:hypothetical protein